MREERGRTVRPLLAGQIGQAPTHGREVVGSGWAARAHLSEQRFEPRAEVVGLVDEGLAARRRRICEPGSLAGRRRVFNDATEVRVIAESPAAMAFTWSGCCSWSLRNS